VDGTGIGVWGCGGAFWQAAWQIVGFDDYMMKTVTDLDFCRRVTEYLAAPQVVAAEMACERYPFIFYGIGDNIATTRGPFINPDTLKELWCPWAKKVFDIARASDIPVFLNTDGKIDWILDDLVEMGVDALNPIDPHGNDIFEVKAKYGDKLCLMGGIGQHWPLSVGTEKEVEEDVRHCIERLRGDGGYVVCSSHDIGDNVKPENWVAMLRAIEKYG
jgi:uroporphyrinogen decarboxylase